jgi:hypothetical protein
MNAHAQTIISKIQAREIKRGTNKHRRVLHTTRNKTNELWGMENVRAKEQN